MSAEAHYTGLSRYTHTLSGSSETRHELRLSRNWPQEQVRTVRGCHREAIFLGDCFASEEHIERLLVNAPDAVTAADRLGALAGSYCVVVTEGPDLVWAGDLAGVHRLWYTQSTEGVRFSSSPGESWLTQDPKVSLEGLSIFLFLPGLSDLLGACAIEGAHPVDPRCLLHVREGRAVLHRRVLPQAGSTMEEGALLLRSALLQTIDDHCGRAVQVSCDLSGGLDSSTLAVLASRVAVAPISTLTYTDDFSRNRDDLVYAERIARHIPGSRWEMVEGDYRTLPYSGLAHVPATDVPSLEPLIWARTRARLKPAARGGTHVVGDGGDVVVGAPLTYLAELARPRHGRRFLSEAYALARLRQRPVRPVIRAALKTARAGFGKSLAELSRLLDSWQPSNSKEQVRELESGISWTPVDESVAWATDTSRARLVEGTQWASSVLGPEHEGADAHSVRTIHRHAEATRVFLGLSHRMGVHVQAPFFDNRVVAACLSVPAKERATALSPKPLLSASMVGLVPAELYARRTKDDYGACEYHGLRRNSTEIRALLREGHLFESGVVRPEPVLRVLETAIAGGRAPMAVFQRVLAAELWLRARRARPFSSTQESSPITVGAMR